MKNILGRPRSQPPGGLSRPRSRVETDYDQVLGSSSPDGPFELESWFLDPLSDGGRIRVPIHSAVLAMQVAKQNIFRNPKILWGQYLRLHPYQKKSIADLLSEKNEGERYTYDSSDTDSTDSDSKKSRRTHQWHLLALNVLDKTRSANFASARDGLLCASIIIWKAPSHAQLLPWRSEVNSEIGPAGSNDNPLSPPGLPNNSGPLLPIGGGGSQPQTTNSSSRPTFVRVHRRYLSPSTLDSYNLPWTLDERVRCPIPIHTLVD